MTIFSHFRFSRIHRYGDQVNSHDLLKFIAIVLMIIDHVGFYLLENEMWYRTFGRAAAPLFFFAVGYMASFRFKESLLVYGIILTFANYVFMGFIGINILINFIIIKWVFSKVNPARMSHLILGISVVLLTAANFLPHYLEYGAFGLLFATCARLFAQNDRRGQPILIITLIAYFFVELDIFHFNVLQSIALIGIEVVLYYVFINYSFINIKLKSFTRYLILFFSRYSLEVYFYHLLFLKILAFTLKLQS